MQTLEELATAGAEGLSIERIAQRAEVNKTSIYRRWPTREALVAAALAGILDRAETTLPDTGSLRGDLIGLLTPIAGMLGHAMGRAVVRAAFSASSESSIAALATARLGQQAAGPLSVLISRAKARGEWRRGAKGEQVVFMLVGAMIHRAMLEHAPMTRSWIASLVDLILLGVFPREAEVKD